MNNNVNFIKKFNIQNAFLKKKNSSPPPVPSAPPGHAVLYIESHSITFTPYSVGRRFVSCIFDVSTFRRFDLGF